MDRNDVVYSFQNNRNPFVDHPEWVECLYLNECSGSGGGSGGGSGSELANGETRSSLSGSSGAWDYYTIEVPAGASNLVVAINGGSGDADLYVRYGSQPTTSSYTCRPYLNGNNETCTISSLSAGTYHIGIRAYSTYSGVSLSADYDVGGGSGGGTTGEEHYNVSGSQGQWKNFTFEIPSGVSSFSVNMSGGSGDADLYVRRNALPTLSNYDCRPYRWGNDETCDFTNPAAGTWYISIYGYEAYSGITLEYEYVD